MKYLKTYEQKLNTELSNFATYVFDFYGKNDGIYRNIFNNELTMNIIEDNIIPFIEKRKDFFEGDSLDREIFRDYLLIILGFSDINDTEFSQILLDDIFSKEDLEKAKIKYNSRKYNI